MPGRLQLSRLSLKNVLSFGPDSEPVELGALNVLIGPNTSGKSNFVDAIGLCGSLPSDISVPVREGGGIHQWLWRGGERKAGELPTAFVEADVREDDDCSWRHTVEFGMDGVRVRVVDELVVNLKPDQDDNHLGYLFAYEGGKPVVRVSFHGTVAGVSALGLRDGQSILSRHNDPVMFPALSKLRTFYQGIRIYRDWNTGRSGPFRTPQPADLPEDFLMPNAENLGVVLNNLQRHTDAWEALNARLARLHPSLKEVKTLVQANTIQLMLRESDLRTLTPATRMSDGTLRYLALLTVLLHPEPPSLVAIEEPELGLHPDLISDLAALLIDASSRTQLVVTTHSDHLINALSVDPAAVLVAEREAQGTTLRRLDPERLRGWLQKYKLGELWMKGEIGGTRW